VGSEAQRSSSKRWKATAAHWGPLAPATPLILTVFGVTATGDFDRDYERFRVLSFIAFIAAMIGLTMALGYPSWPIALAAMLTTQSYPVKINVVEVAAKPTALLLPVLLVAHALAVGDLRRVGAWALGALPAIWIALEVPGRVLGGAVD
jgi:hypothetical protein